MVPQISKKLRQRGVLRQWSKLLFVNEFFLTSKKLRKPKYKNFHAKKKSKKIIKTSKTLLDHLWETHRLIDTRQSTGELLQHLSTHSKHIFKKFYDVHFELILLWFMILSQFYKTKVLMKSFDETAKDYAETRKTVQIRSIRKTWNR